MTDAFIFYTGLFCFGLIVVAFVLTILEFRKMSRRGARKAARGSAWASGEGALVTASSGGRVKR